MIVVARIYSLPAKCASPQRRRGKITPLSDVKWRASAYTTSKDIGHKDFFIENSLTHMTQPMKEEQQWEYYE